MDRRAFTKLAIAASLSLGGAGRALAAPDQLAQEPDVGAAFDATTEAQALAALFGSEQSQPSDQITLFAPLITTADLGAEINVHSGLASAKALAITVSEVERPLAAYVRLTGARCFFFTTLRIDRTVTVAAHVLTDNGVLSASSLIKVTRGGFG